MKRLPRVMLTAVYLLVTGLTGCNIASGNRLTLFPESERILPATRDVVHATPYIQQLPRELDKRVLPPYQVEAGDTLLLLPADPNSTIRVPSDQVIMPDGTIDLGIYGRPVIAGKTIEEIEATVKSSIEVKERNVGQIEVRLVGRKSKVYYVLGEVNTPGAFPLDGRETVLDAIVAAGGLSARASREDIILARPTGACDCRTVYPVCYQAIVQLGDTSTNYQIMPGDRVYVASRSIFGGRGMFGKKKKICDVCKGPQWPCPPLPPVCPPGAAGCENGICPAPALAPANTVEVFPSAGRLPTTTRK